MIEQNLGDTVEKDGCVIYIYDTEINGELMLTGSGGLKIMMRNKRNECIQSRERILKPLTSAWLRPNVQVKKRNNCQRVTTFPNRKKSEQHQKGDVFSG